MGIQPRLPRVALAPAAQVAVSVRLGSSVAMAPVSTRSCKATSYECRVPSPRSTGLGNTGSRAAFTQRGPPAALLSPTGPCLGACWTPVSPRPGHLLSEGRTESGFSSPFYLLLLAELSTQQAPQDDLLDRWMVGGRKESSPIGWIYLVSVYLSPTI